MNILIMCLIWAVVASCWDVMMGFAGIFSFGQVAFFVMGAYCSGILAIDHHVTPVLSILIAGLFTAGMGVLGGAALSQAGRSLCGAGDLWCAYGLAADLKG